jgi:hypothetical protein
MIIDSSSNGDKQEWSWNSFGHHMTTLCEWNDGVTIVKNNFCDGQINCLIHEWTQEETNTC